MREFITPILLGALELYGKSNKLDNTDLQLVCEKRVTGFVGNGPVDYIVTYKTMNIILTEAKKDQIDSGVLQNICQQVAGVQEIARLLTLTTSAMRQSDALRMTVSARAGGILRCSARNLIVSDLRTSCATLRSLS